MKPKLAALQAMFPHITMTVLQERLAAAEGHLPNAVKVTLFPMKAFCTQVMPVLTCICCSLCCHNGAKSAQN